MGYITSMTLWDQVRAAILASGQSRYRIAKETGVAQSQFCRLMRGKRGLGIESLERVADYLGLEIVVRPKRRQRKR
jgi:transcriptional regulator with XRE-family HTH domain